MCNTLFYFFLFFLIQKVASQFVVEVKNRKKDLEHFNLLASQLQHRNALCGQEMTLNLINGDWDQIMQGVKGLIPTQNGNGLEIRASGDGGGGSSKLFTAPGSPLMRSAPMEVATRMAKVPFIYYASTFIARNLL